MHFPLAVFVSCFRCIFRVVSKFSVRSSAINTDRHSANYSADPTTVHFGELSYTHLAWRLFLVVLFLIPTYLFWGSRSCRPICRAVTWPPYMYAMTWSHPMNTFEMSTNNCLLCLNNCCENWNIKCSMAVGAGMMYSIQLHWLQAVVGDLFSSAKSLDRVWDPHWLLFSG